MDKSFSQLEKELAESKNREKHLKVRVSTWRQRALEAKRMQKSMVSQYERVVREWQKMYYELLTNGWKLLATKIVLKYKEMRGGGK